MILPVQAHGMGSRSSLNSLQSLHGHEVINPPLVSLVNGHFCFTGRESGTRAQQVMSRLSHKLGLETTAPSHAPVYPCPIAVWLCGISEQAGT